MTAFVVTLLFLVAILLAYRQGAKDQSQFEQKETPESPHAPPYTPPQPSREEVRYRILADNIEVYNGTGDGQKEVSI